MIIFLFYNKIQVLRQHWKQILQIFQKSLVDQDDISCVVSHVQHAVTLLTDEVASQDRPGPILLYFINEAILDTFFVWSLSCPEYASELKYHQLRCFEFLLSRSQQELLFHKQIVRFRFDFFRYFRVLNFSLNHCSIFSDHVNHHYHQMLLRNI